MLPESRAAGWLVTAGRGNHTPFKDSATDARSVRSQGSGPPLRSTDNPTKAIPRLRRERLEVPPAKGHLCPPSAPTSNRNRGPNTEGAFDAKTTEETSQGNPVHAVVPTTTTVISRPSHRNAQHVHVHVGSPACVGLKVQAVACGLQPPRMSMTARHLSAPSGPVPSGDGSGRMAR